MTNDDHTRLLRENAMLSQALQYIVEHEWTAETRQAGQWIKEFVDVASKALRTSISPLPDRVMPPVLEVYKKKPDESPRHILDDL